MSEEKKTPAKKEEPGKGAKILNWFKTLPQRIAKPFRNMYYELKKVTWPSKHKLITYSIIVAPVSSPKRRQMMRPALEFLSIFLFMVLFLFLFVGLFVGLFSFRVSFAKIHGIGSAIPPIVR